jgi:stage V sporulation protein S
MTLLKVSSRSNPNAVAGAFAAVIREQGHAEVCVIGAGALNQAVKAAAIARTFLAPQGIDLVCIPEFCDLDIDGEQRTGIRLVVDGRTAEGDPGDDSAMDDRGAPGHHQVRERLEARLDTVRVRRRPP